MPKCKREAANKFVYKSLGVNVQRGSSFHTFVQTTCLNIAKGPTDPGVDCFNKFAYSVFSAYSAPFVIFCIFCIC